MQIKTYLLTLSLVGFAACSSSGGVDGEVGSISKSDNLEPSSSVVAMTKEDDKETSSMKDEIMEDDTARQASNDQFSDCSNAMVNMETSMGNICLNLFEDKAPNHVKNFVDLANRGVYDGTLFHRVIPNFMIQGGDPLTKDPKTPRKMMGTGNATDENGKEIRVKAEFNDTPHARGTLSMARSNDPNSASSQFFIVRRDSFFLDNNYTAFGEVESGIEVVDKIADAKRDALDNPLEPIEIIKVTINE